MGYAIIYYLLGTLILKLRGILVFCCLCLVFVCCFVSMSRPMFEKAMLGYLPLCADNGRELTSVAFMCKKDQCTG